MDCQGNVTTKSTVFNTSNVKPAATRGRVKKTEKGRARKKSVTISAEDYLENTEQIMKAISDAELKESKSDPTRNAGDMAEVGQVEQ